MIRKPIIVYDDVFAQDHVKQPHGLQAALLQQAEGFVGPDLAFEA